MSGDTDISSVTTTSLAKDKSKVKTYEQKAISAKVCFAWAKSCNYIPPVYRLAAFIVNQKWKNKICKLGKVDDRIQEQKTKINRDMNWERWF